MKPFSDRFEAGPDLPTEMSQHCMVQLNQTHTFVLNTDGSTYLYDWSAGSWREMSSLPEPRVEMGCGAVSNADAGKADYVIIAGGLNVADHAYKYVVDFDLWQTLPFPGPKVVDPVSLVSFSTPFQ